MTQLRSEYPIGKYCHLVINLGTCLGNKSTTVAVGRPDNKQNRCRTGEECECEEFRLGRGSPLACGVMCFVSSSSECLLIH